MDLRNSKRRNPALLLLLFTMSVVSNLGSLIHPLPPELRKQVRDLEKVSFRRCKSDCSLLFNSVCVKENLLPTYSNIRLHDEAARKEPFTLKYRLRLVQRELDNARTKKTTLDQDHSERIASLRRTMDSNVLEPILDTIQNNVDELEAETKLKMLRKLSKLYKAPVVLPDKEVDAFINLSNYTLTDSEKHLLNLGLNCHLQSQVDIYERKVELEILYEGLLDLQTQKIVQISPELQAQLRAEGARQPPNSNSTLLTPELRAAAKSLRENHNIVIRRADKSTTFVILNRDDYRKKIQDVLKDGSKFQKISKNPCENIKSKINNLIDRATSETGQSMPLKKIVGDYSPGYIYGNVKTHKPGEKLRPIISQVTTPTYQTAKQLDKLIKKYLPQGKMLKSSTEFVELLHGNQYSGNLFSLDVESLFTNVPVHRTINIILDRVYHHPTISAPVIPKHTLRDSLLICTTEVPFKDMDGKMYIQCDGVSMGSPLGPTFANFFMAEVENRALSNIQVSLYCRYIDDIFLICDTDTLQILQREMMTISGMNFTFERSVNNKLPFLNVLVNFTDDQVRTSVYRKPTDVGKCLNAVSECPDRYKVSVVKGFLFRAMTLSSERDEMLLEMNRSKQILVNNGYTNKLIDDEIRKFLRREATEQPPPATTTHKIYYKNFMNPNYKRNEKAIKDIINNNVNLINSGERLQVVIYYKSIKTRNLFMKNNLSPKLRDLARTNSIYDFTCKTGECEHLPINKRRYSGLTTCTLSRRLTFHLQNGAIRKHFESCHGRNITRAEIVDMTKARCYQRDVRRLEILEALIIQREDPEINRQDTGSVRILKLHGTVMQSTIYMV